MFYFPADAAPQFLYKLTPCLFDDKEDRCCIFLFEYEGRLNSGCTTVKHDKNWCSLDATCDKKLDNCGKNGIFAEDSLES